MGSREEIRAAMERLLNGDAQHTDGRLTKTNLAVEAGVGRATLYRQHDLMAEWARRVTESDIAPPAASAAATIAHLTRQLADERSRRRESDRIANGLAFVVAELYRALEARTPPNSSRGTIIPINAKTRRRAD
ncbi:Uncharacterised protein [Mycobacteroides abscessus]|uniref:Uncharacterized protein n=2 Tax=Mycobacteroides abscessus TaxID=36809 RepID=A0A829M9T6_9MYCO|nr:hypothetical protein [Mycobacteroides abscessus]ESV58193.1 hypothetical protein L830_4035 [Mycobacteroides abscessus MAB_082312_2258]ESV61581.1 hypothetical protein L833_3976 [Mycobacteroides abscessus MAB_091912_2446]WJJ55891.1 helix-turn-helix DNA binding domain protein [Mycobacterium phage prophiT36-1]AMU24479.1 hypothetical protein A3N96_02790 [Mycobacteroides abscessus]AMU34208.1 hypothetical protein A3N98_02255 [Mycobacteroides abscessus]